MTKKLRQFGILTGTVWGILSFLLWKKKENMVYLYLLFFSSFLLIAGIVAPKTLGPIYKVWTRLTHAMGEVVTRMILGLIFFLVVTPLGLILRLLGKDFLDLKKNANRTTYWVSKEQGFARSNYESQF